MLLFQFAKLARDLVIPGGMRVGGGQQQEGGATEMIDSSVPPGGGPTQLDDDELEDGLCWTFVENISYSIFCVIIC